MKCANSSLRWILAMGLGAFLLSSTFLSAQQDLALPKARNLPLYWVDVPALLKAHPKTAAFETELRAVETQMRSDLEAIRTRWQAAMAAGDSTKTTQVQTEYSTRKDALQKEFQEKKQQMMSTIQADIQSAVDKATETHILGYVIVYDQKLGPYQTGHHYTTSSHGLGDLTFALECFLKGDPGATTQVNIITPQIGPCYKVNFDTLLQQHPQNASLNALMNQDREAEQAQLKPYQEELTQLQKEVETLTQQGVTGEALDEVVAQARGKQAVLISHQNEAQIRLGKRRNQLIKPMMEDIQDAIHDLMPPDEDYLIVSDHTSPRSLPAFQVPEGLTISDITAQVSAQVKASQ